MTDRKPRINWTEIAVYSAVISVVMGAMYYDWHTGRLRWWRGLHITCQHTARVIGQLGITAERRYFALIEQNRTV